MVRGDLTPKDTFRTVVHLALFNNKGEMLIQQRQKDKKGWANMWDVSVGGSVISGETSIEGIQRETLEELGLDIDFSKTRPAITYAFETGFDDYYIIRKNINADEIKLQLEEVQNIKFATKEEIFDLIDKGEFIPYNKEFISILFYLRNHKSLINTD